MNKSRPKWAQSLWWWLTDGWYERQWPNRHDEFADRVTRAGQRMLCWAFGHRPIPDQCAKPEHDACALCNKAMPGRAERRSA